MTLQLSDQQYMELSGLAYLDLAGDLNRVEYENTINVLIDSQTTLANIDNKIHANNGTPTGTLTLYQRDNNGNFKLDEKGLPIPLKEGVIKNYTQIILPAIKADPVLSRLVLIGHQNDNIMPGNEKGSGFVGYAFKDPETGDVVFAMRGSEGELDLVKAKDWNDNFVASVFKESEQYAVAKAFVEKYKTDTGSNYITGHSKGGGLSAYIVASFDNFTGRGFNGSGISPQVIIDNPELLFKLWHSDYVNYRTENDIVSKVLVHLEKTVTVDMRKYYNEDGILVDPAKCLAVLDAHSLQSFEFTGNDSVKVSESQVVGGIPEMVDDVDRGLAMVLSGIEADFGVVGAYLKMMKATGESLIQFESEVGSELVAVYKAEAKRLTTDFIKQDYSSLIRELNNPLPLTRGEIIPFYKKFAISVGKFVTDLEKAGADFLETAGKAVVGFLEIAGAGVIMPLNSISGVTAAMASNTSENRASGKMVATPDRILDLANKMRGYQITLEDTCRDLTYDVERALSNVCNDYPESYVRQACHQASEELNRCKRQFEKIGGQLGDLSKDLRKTAEAYADSERRALEVVMG